MTDVFLFAGPTLPPDAIAARLGPAPGGVHTFETGHQMTVLPPVSEGDIAGLADKKPAIIAIVDGYFENVPAVWHKEILYAMARGIHVMGASSMGALRAAELAAFGMQGIGSIFQAYAGGRWEDDDEVTVAHGPAELGYPAVSEAMANIRVTFDHALATAAMTLPEWTLLTSIAKNMFYKDRSYPAVLAAAVSQGLEKSRAEALGAWLAAHRRDQKRMDALELLDAIAAQLRADTGRKKVLYNFEDTVIWRRARSLTGSLGV
jgi:hypothetical protein